MAKTKEKTPPGETPLRITEQSETPIGYIDPKVFKQIEKLDSVDREYLLKVLRKPIPPNKRRPYTGNHVRPLQVFHTHVSDNLMFNWMMRDSYAAILFLGLHQDVEGHADTLKKKGVDLEVCVSIYELLRKYPEPAIAPDVAERSASEADTDLELPAMPAETPTAKTNDFREDLVASLQFFVQTHAKEATDDAANQFHKRSEDLDRQFEELRTDVADQFESVAQSIAGFDALPKAIDAVSKQVNEAKQRSEHLEKAAAERHGVALASIATLAEKMTAMADALAAERVRNDEARKQAGDASAQFVEFMSASTQKQLTVESLLAQGQSAVAELRAEVDRVKQAIESASTDASQFRSELKAGLANQQTRLEALAAQSGELGTQLRREFDDLRTPLNAFIESEGVRWNEQRLAQREQLQLIEATDRRCGEQQHRIEELEKTLRIVRAEREADFLLRDRWQAEQAERLDVTFRLVERMQRDVEPRTWFGRQLRGLRNWWSKSGR